MQRPALEPPVSEGPTLAQAVGRMFRQPYALLVKRWNWKSSTTSSVVRAAIFFAVNLRAGQDAAWAAFWTEFIYRALTSGFYGAITQVLSEVRPRWQGTVGALLLLPIANHALEFVAHWYTGTEELFLSILASMCFTALSSTFHVFVMRRGLLTVGDGSQGLLSDLAQMPKAVALFVAWPFIGLWRLAFPEPKKADDAVQD